MLFLQFFYGLVALLACFVAAVPLAEGDLNITAPYNLDLTNPAIASEHGYDPSFFWDPRSTMQVWMGKDKTQVGNVVDERLYMAMHDLLSDVCPVESIRRVCHKSPFVSIRSACMNVAGQHRPCDFVITKIDAEWATDAIRQYLITAVAYALKAATAQDVSKTDGNCWSSGILTKVCNVGDVVRVNFPELPEGRANYMHVTFANLFTGYGSYECCGEGIRARLDGYVDTLHDRMKLEFPKQADNAWFRDSRCIINGQATCPDGARDN